MAKNVTSTHSFTWVQDGKHTYELGKTPVLMEDAAAVQLVSVYGSAWFTITDSKAKVVPPVQASRTPQVGHPLTAAELEALEDKQK